MNVTVLLRPALAALVLLTGCNAGSSFPRPEAQQLAAAGRRITGNGDLRQPNFTNGGESNFLTVTGADLAGREAVFVLNAATLAFDLVSRAETFLDQITGHRTDPAHRVDHVDRHTNGATLIRNRPGNGLPDPPGSIS